MSSHLAPAAFSVIQSSSHSRMKCKAPEEGGKKKGQRATERPQPHISVFRLRRRLFSSLLKVPSPCECDEEADFLYATARKGPSLGMCIVCVCLCCLQRLPCLPLFQGEWGRLPTPIDPAYYNSCGPAPTSLPFSFSHSPPPPPTTPASLLLLLLLLLNINPAAAGSGHKEVERGVVFQKRP